MATDNSDNPAPKLSLIDQICDNFERALKEGQNPHIEDGLSAVEADQRSQLLIELLRVEVHHRNQKGESPTRTDYVSRFPLQSQALDAVFGDESFPSTDELSQGEIASTILGPPEESGFPETDNVSKKSLRGKFGDFELIEEIARGGMGVVYKARQVKLNRLVALKMILSGQMASAEEVRRFYTEAEAAAHLDHPHIVPIYDVGQFGGQHFFSMGFVQGRSLQDRLKAGPISPREAAEILVTICEAVHYAHQRGIVHRDLKPGNILLEENGKAWVTDFGLARQVGADSSLTQTGQVMGTPSYMPPEQARGELDQIGPLTDVYSLGAVLYALLTGRPPFQSANVYDTLSQVVNEEPVRPRLLNPVITVDLETIILKCLAKHPADRYSSAEQMAADLQSWLIGEPVQARQRRGFALVWNWLRRHPQAALLALGAMLTALVGSVVQAQEIGNWIYGPLSIIGGALLIGLIIFVVISLAEHSSSTRANKHLAGAMEDLNAAVFRLISQTKHDQASRQAIGRQMLEFYERFLRRKGLDGVVVNAARVTRQKLLDVVRVVETQRPFPSSERNSQMPPADGRSQSELIAGPAEVAFSESARRWKTTVAVVRAVMGVLILATIATITTLMVRDPQMHLQDKVFIPLVVSGILGVPWLLTFVLRPPVFYLIKLLWHPAPTVRLKAATLLEQAGEEARKAGSALTERLNDPDPEVRVAAAKALGATGLNVGADVSQLEEAVGRESLSLENPALLAEIKNSLRTIKHHQRREVVDRQWLRTLGQRVRGLFLDNTGQRTLTAVILMGAFKGLLYVGLPFSLLGLVGWGSSIEGEKTFLQMLAMMLAVGGGYGLLGSVGFMVVEYRKWKNRPFVFAPVQTNDHEVRETPTVLEQTTPQQTVVTKDLTVLISLRSRRKRATRFHNAGLLLAMLLPLCLWLCGVREAIWYYPAVIVPMIAGFLIAQRIWRCPTCNATLGRDYYPAECGQCRTWFGDPRPVLNGLSRTFEHPLSQLLFIGLIISILIVGFNYWDPGVELRKRRLYLDNYTKHELSLTLDGEPWLALPAGTSRVETLEPGPHQVMARKPDQQVLGRWNIPETPGASVLNFDRRQHYLQHETVYSRQKGRPPAFDEQLIHEEFFNVNAKYIFETPPRSVALAETTTEIRPRCLKRLSGDQFRSLLWGTWETPMTDEKTLFVDFDEEGVAYLSFDRHLYHDPPVLTGFYRIEQGTLTLGTNKGVFLHGPIREQSEGETAVWSIGDDQQILQRSVRHRP